MATKEEVELLIGKAFLEPEFRNEFLSSPEAAAKKLGIELTVEQVKAFKAIEICAIAEHLDRIASKTSFFA